MYKVLVLLLTVSYTTAEFVFNDTIFMPTLDRQVTKMMLEPEEGNGPKFLKDAFFLYQNILAAYESISDSDKRGIETYLDFMRDGGPTFIKISYEDELLRKVYKWGPDEMEEMKAIMAATEKAFKKLERKAIDFS